MNLKTDKCLFCNRNCHSALSQHPRDGEIFYNCENCKQYFISQELLSCISKYTEVEKKQISQWLKNREKIDFDLVLTKDFIDKIINNKKK